MKRFFAFAFAAVVAACSAASDQDSAEAANSTTGPGEIHPGWFKTPESIAETMTKTWGLELTPQEELQNFGGLRAALGGVNVSQQGSPVAKPHELFALATHSLSVFAAEKLIAKQIQKTAASQSYLFDGLDMAGPDEEGCFADDAKDWCDAKDEITIGSLTAGGFDPKNPTKADRKRLMHKMQSIAEFFLMVIDDRTMMPVANGAPAQHAPAFLVDEVFLPKLLEAPLSQEQERQAWQEVVATILMSGYYFDLPAEL